MIDLSNVKAQTPQLLPDGKYICYCTEAKMADTKSGGMRIAAVFTVAESELEGRKIFHSFNVENANIKAVEIGLAQLKAFMEAAGHANPNALGSTQELEGLRVGIKTKTRKSEEYGDSTEVSYFFKPTEGSSQVKSSGSTATPF